MVASPNYIRYVFDGDGSDAPNPGPPGSEYIEKLFRDYFAVKGLPTDPSPLDGSSDYGPFADMNIPVGGLYAGSSEIKTNDQALRYGGVAGEPCDPHYHTAGDTVEHLNDIIEGQILNAIAYAVYTYSRTPLAAKTLQAEKPHGKYRSTYKGRRIIQK